LKLLTVPVLQHHLWHQMHEHAIQCDDASKVHTILVH